MAGSGRLSEQEQRGTALAYLTAFFRTYLGGESEFLPFLTGNFLPPPSAMIDELFLSFHSPDDPLLRRDVNRLIDAANLNTNTLGGIVTQTGLSPYDLCGGDPPQEQRCLPTEFNSRQPHTTPSFLAPGMRGLSQLRIEWNVTTAIYKNELPVGGRDVSGYFAAQFRASVNFAVNRNPPDMPQDLSVALTDGNGDSSSVRVSDITDALFFPPGGAGPVPVPKVVLNTVQIPLSAFSGVDLTDVRSIEFAFDQESEGALLITDLAFTNISQPPYCNANGPYAAESTGTTTQITLNGTGLFDPEGDLLTLTWTGIFGTAVGFSPTVEFPLGDFTVELQVNDGFASAFCNAPVTVEDTTPPEVTAAIVSVGEMDDDEGIFRVEFSCSDTCDSNATITSAELNGIAVTNGQLVKLERDDETEVEWDDGVLEIEAPSFELVVTCNDASGNIKTASAVPSFGDDDDDD